MELLKLSKFKLQLRALVAEVRELRDKEHSVTEQLNLSIQKQNQMEEEFGRKLAELQAELSLSNEIRQKLERKVDYLQSDNTLLEKKQKELKGTINSLLESRENFLKIYEDSTCELKRSIQTRDRKLAILDEKINSHLLLFDSIEKETIAIKKVLDDVQHIVDEKEGIVAGLKSKMDKLSAYEKIFVGNISDMQGKLSNLENELRNKKKKISELEVQIEEAKMGNHRQQQIEEKTLSVKDMVIQNLQSDKKALQLELWGLGIILQKIQETVRNMNEEDRRAFLLVMEYQEGRTEIKENKNSRLEDLSQNTGKTSPCSGCEGCTVKNIDSVHQGHDSVNSPSLGHSMDPLIPEKTYSQPQPAANVPSISVTEAKGNGTTLVCHHDSESSTTQAELSKDPG